jgi:hypothetical protein
MEHEWRKFENLQVRSNYMRRIVVSADYLAKPKATFRNTASKLVHKCPREG